MIERFTRKGLRMAVTGIASAATVAAALAFTTPAMAATAAPAPVAPAATVDFTTTGQLTTTQVNATTYCSTTPVNAVHGSIHGLVVWWVKMQTRWCWNRSTVTSHSTSVQHWTGANANFDGAPLHFSCPNGCRENSESIQNSPMFDWFYGTAGIAWNVHLWQNEFYNGSWNAGWSATSWPF